MLAAIRTVIGEHPGYGWRRMQSELLEVHGLAVNHKRLKRVLCDHELGLRRMAGKHKKSGPAGLLSRHKGSVDLVRGREFAPFEAFSTDFTELAYAGGRKAWLMVLVDIHSKLAMGWGLAASRNRALAIATLDALCATLESFGLAPYDRIVHHDKDSVYTSYAWLAEVLIRRGMRVSYSEAGARHNPWVESLWSRFKDECESQIAEAGDLEVLRQVIDTHMDYYNHRRRHSALGNMTPMGYLHSEGFRRLSGN